MNKFYVVRKHEIHAGHRVCNSNSKCENIHGHSYIIHFYCHANDLNDIGMVIDFSVIKHTLCKWLDDNYDHRLILWEKDPWKERLLEIDNSIVTVPYNPTAENIANHLLNIVAPDLLKKYPIRVVKVVVEETSKCMGVVSNVHE